MKKILFFIFGAGAISCSQIGRPDTSNFSEEQIEQLDLPNTQMLHITDTDRVTLDFNPFLCEKEISISKLIDSIQLIPLETNEESLIAGIDKLICTAQFYFVLDADIGGNVLIFNHKGEFVKKIPTGGGPKEIYNPGDIAVDEEQKQLLVYNRKGISFYTYQGKFLKREILPFNFKNFRIIPGGYLFVVVRNQNNHLKQYSDMQVFITDKKFRIVSAGFPFHYSKEINWGVTDYTSSWLDNTYFSFKFTHLIYQYVDTANVRVKYQLDFLNKAIPNRCLQMNMNELFDVLEGTDYYYFMGQYVENETHECFVLHNNHNRSSFKTFIFRNKETKQLIGGNKIILNDTIPFFGHPIASYEDKFIGVVNSESVFNFLKENNNKRKYSKLEQLDEDANPILAIYKLK